MTDSFLPTDYSMPKEGGYMKFKLPENKFRALGIPVLGWEYFTNENKPKRFPMDRKPNNPSDLGEKSKVNHFWAFPVYNYQTSSIELLKITQSGILNAIKAYIDNPKRGNPMEYDIIVKKTGDGLESKYTVTVDPKEKMPKDILDKYNSLTITLDDWMNNLDWFTTNPF